MTVRFLVCLGSSKQCDGSSRLGNRMRDNSQPCSWLSLRGSQDPASLSNAALPVAVPSRNHSTKEKKRVPADGGLIKWVSLFAALRQADLLPALSTQSVSNRSAPVSAVPKKNSGSLDSLRRMVHRVGKTVTVVTGFVEIGQAEQERLTKQKQKACSAGGMVKEGRLTTPVLFMQGGIQEEGGHMMPEFKTYTYNSFITPMLSPV